MLGKQKQKGSDTLSVKIPKWMAELLNLIAKGKGENVNANHLLTLCLQFIVESAKCDGPVPVWMRTLIDMMKLDGSWNSAFNFASVDSQMDVAQVILVLQQHDGKKPRQGFGLAMIDKPFMGEARVTYCVDDIFERVAEVGMKGLYKQLRQIGVELESESVRETLTRLCDAQTIVNMKESDEMELPGYGDRHDFGRVIGYGKKFVQHKHRTPDSLANAQQRIAFDDQDRSTADEEAGRDNDEQEPPIKPFGVEW